MTAAPDEVDLTALLTAWGRDLRRCGEPQMTSVAAQKLVRRLGRTLATALATSPPDVESAGEEIGRVLAESRLTTGSAVQATVRVLGVELPPVLASLPSAGGDDAAGGRAVVARLQGALAAGYAAGLKALVLQQQDELHEAVTAAREHAEAARRGSEARFRALFAGAAIGIGIGDVDGNIIEVNPALRRMLGYSLEEFRSRNVASFMHPDDAASVWPDYDDLVQGRRDSFRTEKWFHRKDGSPLWTHLTVSLIRGDDGAPLYQVAMMEDVTVRHELEERLRHQALHDGLTGLPNRALLLDRLEDALGSAEEGDRVGLCFVDLDDFKVINDGLGHMVGDQVLVAVADRFTAALEGSGALLARLGGDEFVVLLARTRGAGQVVELADRLRRTLEQPVPVDDRFRLTLSSSIGVAEAPATGTTAAELLRAADVTLHWAKHDGKGRVAVHDATRADDQMTRYTLAMSLPGALERGELSVVYQPLVSLRDGGVHGVEALLRWDHPRFGPIDPQSFVGVAEETGAIVPLGRWVLEQACRDVLAWGDQWPDGALLSVNVSAQQLKSPGIVADVARTLERTGLTPSCLQLEVTESAVLTSDGGSAVAALEELSRLGVRVALDDFGTGYSNMARLRRLPLTELKLAGELLAGLSSQPVPDPVDTRILTTLVDLAHAMGLTVTAEGIETAEQDVWVRESGCDSAQGWFYGRPVAPGGPLRADAAVPLP